jgi:hypothetical protein
VRFDFYFCIFYFLFIIFIYLFVYLFIHLFIYFFIFLFFYFFIYIFFIYIFLCRCNGGGPVCWTDPLLCPQTTSTATHTTASTRRCLHTSYPPRRACRCVCVYMLIYAYILILICVYVYVYMCLYVFICLYASICLYVVIYPYSCLHTSYPPRRACRYNTKKSIKHHFFILKFQLNPLLLLLYFN